MEARLQVLHDLDLNLAISPKRYKNMHKVENDYLFKILEEMANNNLICYTPVEDTQNFEGLLKDISITKEGRKYLISNI
ncbi:hypothetical protein GC105_08725 [Alkalibaculum sp. M08DMB]|uniref:Uncharacterized protein n=1 Tax=Alkalibaculum sporogenes TaxID=2655001 RepID=A0A6A7K905_9FIRM|nr:hypothetical protein [Alkalibaculum sporogenes]MPW25872.1 hypothetical protein [Alkalibaculum sporogenes]